MSFTGSRSRLTEYCKATRHVFGHAVQTYGADIRSRHVVQTCGPDMCFRHKYPRYSIIQSSFYTGTVFDSLAN